MACNSKHPVLQAELNRDTHRVWNRLENQLRAQCLHLNVESENLREPPNPELSRSTTWSRDKGGEGTVQLHENTAKGAAKRGTPLSGNRHTSGQSFLEKLRGLH